MKSYNDMKESSESVTDKDVQNQLAKLDKLFTDHKKELRKLVLNKYMENIPWTAKPLKMPRIRTLNLS